MRTIVIACLLAFPFSAAAYAADDSLDKSARKVEKNLGEALQGAGQEIKKLGIGNEGKKDDKKSSKTAAKSKEEKK